jgi:hypothetical protein
VGDVPEAEGAGEGVYHRKYVFSVPGNLQGTRGFRPGAFTLFFEKRLYKRPLLSETLNKDVHRGLPWPKDPRVDFALIKETERVFGIDNLNGRHRHPFGGVEQHQTIKEPALAEIFSEIKGVIIEQRLLTERGR